MTEQPRAGQWMSGDAFELHCSKNVRPILAALREVNKVEKRTPFRFTRTEDGELVLELSASMTANGHVGIGIPGGEEGDPVMLQIKSDGKRVSRVRWMPVGNA